ncbi:hypothetical protein HD553DRAFT_326056 [Filobasidium floriforme]|uniref:uncharacterized protein n=1 Tax=Filobasidium floriforme TaxID=5210 RepID=UPI001E8E0D0A|nr:uncharacterized protein HD553DRAFT_326056 [Filobasidium floriforme]KAH8080062.1 hypothetical protein HD553DRAFT_326056 [Filobasidium floriforme]
MSYARATASSTLRVAAIPSSTSSSPPLVSSKKTLSSSSSTPVSIAKPAVPSIARRTPSTSTTTTTSRPARIVSDSKSKTAKSQSSSTSVVANKVSISSTIESRQAQRAREAAAREEKRAKEDAERKERIASLEARKAALKQAKANREAALAARIKRDQDRKDRELREIRRGVEAIKKALKALSPKMTITTPEEVRTTTIPAHRTKVPVKSALKRSKMVDDCTESKVDSYADPYHNFPLSLLPSISRLIRHPFQIRSSTSGLEFDYDLLSIIDHHHRLSIIGHTRLRMAVSLSNTSVSGHVFPSPNADRLILLFASSSVCFSARPSHRTTHYIDLIPYIDVQLHPPLPLRYRPLPTSAAFGIDDLQFITKMNKTFPLQETINQERKMMGLPPMVVPELPANWNCEEPRQRACRFGSREVSCFSYRGVPAYHEVVYHEITDADKTFALRLNEKLDVRVAEIAKSEQARKESEEQARKAYQTRTLTEEEIAEALVMLGDIKKRCQADTVPRITLSVPELYLTEPENQDEEDARFAEQQARRVWTDFSRLVIPPSMWTADERGQEIEDEEETY